MDENRISDQTEEVPEETGPQKPVVEVTISPNHMEAEIELHRAGTDTLAPVYEDVMAALTEAGVTFGINEARLREMCETPRFNAPYYVARGKAAETGADGSVDYKIDTVRELKPKIRPDGTVDYRDLGLIQNVAKGQVLCVIHPAQKGADGIDVCGNVLEGRMGKAPDNVMGKNTSYTEDNLQLIADCDGNAEVRRGVVDVISLLKINGNVDNSTGDIDFIGDVQIMGDVLSGFKVISGGSITIKGTVEGATIQAVGDIVVNEGINGMNRGSIIAGGILKCKYIQSSFIKADTAIYADSIMYCVMECGGNVELSGKRGVLIGGRSTISGGLTARTLGTDSHIATQVIMQNEDKKLTEERQQLEKRLADINGEELKLNQIINRLTDVKQKTGRTTPEIEEALTSAAGTLKQGRLEKMKKTVRLEEVKQEQLRQSRENNCYIECKNRVHVGVQLTFGPLNMQVQQSFVFSRVALVGDEITVTPLTGGK